MLDRSQRALVDIESDLRSETRARMLSRWPPSTAFGCTADENAALFIVLRLLAEVTCHSGYARVRAHAQIGSP